METLVVPVILAIAIAVNLAFWKKPWRVHARDNFQVSMSAEDAQRLVEAVAARRTGWAVSTSTPGETWIGCRITLATWRKEIRVFVQAASGTEASVHLTSASPQLVDWGDGRRALRELRGGLSGGRSGPADGTSPTK